ncbi:hypothetical protein F8S13_18205 [Chloroflexia bacterium SDU3-3]|nr:hypothetical protein F8S13_18205 [Chloroflexia bacterium SDU3-3]
MANSAQFLATAIEYVGIIFLAIFFFPFLIPPVAMLIQSADDEEDPGTIRSTAMLLIAMAVQISLWGLHWGKKNEGTDLGAGINAFRQLMLNAVAINVLGQLATILLGGRISYAILILTVLLIIGTVASMKLTLMIDERRERD